MYTNHKYSGYNLHERTWIWLVAELKKDSEMSLGLYAEIFHKITC